MCVELAHHVSPTSIIIAAHFIIYFRACLRVHPIYLTFLSLPLRMVRDRGNLHVRTFNNSFAIHRKERIITVRQYSGSNRCTPSNMKINSSPSLLRQSRFLQTDLFPPSRCQFFLLLTSSGVKEKKTPRSRAITVRLPVLRVHLVIHLSMTTIHYIYTVKINVCSWKTAVPAVPDSWREY